VAQSARFTSAHYRRVLAFIRARLDQTVTVDELAREAGMSASHLMRGFNETLGSTPMQFVLAYRVEQARKMPEDPARPLGEIAMECGFSDQAHFWLSFKQLTVQTPMKTLILSTNAALLATSALADMQARTFTFANEDAVLSDTLYLPEGHDGTALPTVLVTGSWTSVEEQMPALYAEELVKSGFAATTIDFRGWSKSGNLSVNTPGGMRFIESATAKISNIEATLECDCQPA